MRLNKEKFNRNIVTPIKKFLLVLLMILVLFGLAHSIVYAFEKETNQRVEAIIEFRRENERN